MASKDKETKYSYMGANGKNSSNKFANIYQDLIDKDSKVESNILSKIHKNNIEEEVESRTVIKEVNAKDAEINAKKRRQVQANKLERALIKSSPVTSVSETNKLDDIDIDKDIEKLKKEKMANKIDDNVSDKTMSFDSIGQRSIDDEIEYIRKKARERVDMDKSSVEIYKEYSDFEKNNSEEDSNQDFETKKISNLKDISENGLKEDTEEDLSNIDSNENRYISDDEEKFSLPSDSKLEKVSNGREFAKNNFRDEETTDVESMEKEVQRIQRLKRQREEEDKGNSRKNRKTKNSRKKDKNNSEETVEQIPVRRNTRAEVYNKKSNDKNNSSGKKKVAIAIIIIFVILIFASALVDRFRTSKVQKPVSQAKVETKKDKNKDKNKETTSKSISRDDEIKKLNDLKSGLNANEKKRVDYIIDNIDSYPQELVKKLIKNPEMTDFVYSYKDREKYNKKNLEGINSSYYVDGDVPLFLQWDRRWGYRKYAKEDLGLSGCGPTSLAMVIRHFDKDSDVNPYTVAKYSQEHGYVSPKNFTSWKLFETGLKKYGLESRDIIPVEAKMKRALDNGDLLIVSVKPGIFTDIGHILVIKGYNKEGDFLINDPNSIVNTNKAWSFDELKDQIRKIWAVNTIGAFDSNSNSNSSNSSSSNSSNSDNNSKENNSSDSNDPSIIQDIDN